MALHACLPSWVALAAAADIARLIEFLEAAEFLEVAEFLEAAELWEVEEPSSSSVVRLPLSS
jgi:hypothetical protein